MSAENDYSYEVVIPFGKDEKVAHMCVEQLKKKLGLYSRVRSVDINKEPEVLP